MIDIASALITAKRKAESAKRLYVDGRLFESGEDARECIRLCRSVRFNGHLPNEATFLLAMVNQKMGFAP